MRQPRSKQIATVHLLSFYPELCTLPVPSGYERLGECRGGTLNYFLIAHPTCLCVYARRQVVTEERYGDSRVFERLTMRSWHPQKSFTSPDPDDTHFVLIVSINDTKRRKNDLSQMFDMELGHDTAAQRMRAQPLNLGDDLGCEPFPRIRRAFTRVIGLHVLKILDC